MLRYKFEAFGPVTPGDWWWGISPEGFGSVAMAVNFAVSVVVSRLTPAPPVAVVEMTRSIRYPRGAGAAVGH